MSNWRNLLNKWKDTFDVSVREPVDSLTLQVVEEKLRGFPNDLLEFYSTCNGISKEWLNILPIENPTAITKTWDGVGRANDPKVTKFMGRDADLLEKFLVFAEIGPMQCAAFDRMDYSIWYEENDELVQTNLSLSSFIETCLKEIADS